MKIEKKAAMAFIFAKNAGKTTLQNIEAFD